MGWTTCRSWRNVRDIASEITNGFELGHVNYRVTAAALVGSTLWTLEKREGEPVEIGCHLLTMDGEGLGHKSLGECMYPYYFDCPLEFLEVAPVACEKWRERVRAYHAAHGSGRA